MIWTILALTLAGVVWLIARSANRQPFVEDAAPSTLDKPQVHDRMAGRSFYCGLVGEQFKNDDGTSRQKVIGTLAKGDTFELIRDRQNKFDSNAVLASAGGKTVGYLPSECAGFVSNWMDKGPGRFLSAKVAHLGYGGSFVDVGLAIGFSIRANQIPDEFLDDLEGEI